MAKTAKLFMTGRSQAVRLPKEFRFAGGEVEIRRDAATGGALLLPLPKRTGNWDAFFEAVAALRPADVPRGFPWRDRRRPERSDLFE